MKKILNNINNRIPKYQGFKAKWSVYLLVYVACITFCFGIVTKHLISQWTINNSWAEIKKIGAAMHGVREVRAENAKLEEINETLINSIGTEGKPVVVKIVNDGSAKSKAMIRAKERFGAEHLAAFEALMDGESGYNPSAQNPKSTAFGMFQFLDTTWASYGCKKTEELDTQIECGLKYIEGRYGNPTNAYKHWLARVPINGKDHGHWY